MKDNLMDWCPVISGPSIKSGGVVVGALVAVGTVILLMIGMRETRPFLFSIPVAFLIALALRYWNNRHQVNLIPLEYKDHTNLN